MAEAGVSFHVGREANATYGETLNGIQLARAVKHQFTHEVDPFVVPGDPASGLLPLVSAEPPGIDGAGDSRVQAYCFRMCTTDVPENRAEWQIYVRVARRMISDVVMSQRHCQQHDVVEDPVGLGAYNMDSHHVRRLLTADGRVRNEGDIQVGVTPYRISWRSIRPRRAECTNLLVPVCLSASHVAFGSIRMEPVFMVLGQSAALAAALAIEAGTPLQDVPYDRLRDRLRAAGQVLDWPAPPPNSP